MEELKLMCPTMPSISDLPPKMQQMLKLPKKLFERSSGKAFLRLTKALVLLTTAYAILTVMPWYLLPLGWVITGTCFASLLAVGYACGTDTFFNNTVVNHIVGQICLIPLMLPFEAWREELTQQKETVCAKVQNYLSCSHFWWCTSFWQGITAHIEALFSLKSKRVLGNLVVLYLVASIFFPLFIYFTGVWGLFKYYIMPLVVYHFWASSFLKTSSLLKLLTNIEKSDLVTLAHYKYPKWVEFLSCELNYAVSSLHQFTTSLNVDLPAEEEESENKDNLKEKRIKQTNPMIPIYNLKEAFKFLKESTAESISVRLEEVDFFALLKSRTGELVSKGLIKDATQARDVIADMLKEVNWITAIFLAVTPVLGAVGVIYCQWYWQTWVLFFLHYLTGGIGITAGYHRLFSHRAYSAHPVFKYTLLFFATGAFQMSCLEWCNDHRAHHRYTDTDKDPYTIKKGFWYAHLGWLLWHREAPKSDIRDLQRDPVMRFQDQYYSGLALLQGIVMPTMIAGLFWGDWMGGFLIASVLSRVLVHHATFCVNSVAHYFGSFTYSDQRTPRDSWLVGLITFGEGYHNFHHEFPYDYRNGAEYHSFDPTKWLIWALSYVGGTYNLMRFDTETIEKGKLQMLEKEVIRRRELLHWGPQPDTLPEYTMEKVKEEFLKGEQLIVVDGFVHDVRGFIDEHPAGSAIVKPYLGKDASSAFNGGVYNHSNAARNMIDTLRIGKLVDKEKSE